MEIEDGIVSEFLVESYENLDQLDRDLSALEASLDDKDRLSSVFRSIHTIKGTSVFLAFPKLERVAHVGENLLVSARDGELLLNGEITSGLLSMVDAIRSILASIEAGEGEGTTLRIKIPLTPAIVPALVVTCDGDRFCIPQVNLLELVRLEGDRVKDQIELLQFVPVYRLRGRLLPRPTKMILVRTNDGPVSLLVHEIGDVMVVDEDTYEPPPETLHGVHRDLVLGTYKLDSGLLFVLDTDAALRVAA